MKVLLIGINSSFRQFEQFLAVSDVEVTSCTAGSEVHELLENENYTAVVVADKLADGDGLTLVRQCAREYPLVNFALESELSAEDFHEATEGLGLFMQLSSAPDEEEAQQLLRLLKKINGLMSS